MLEEELIHTINWWWAVGRNGFPVLSASNWLGNTKDCCPLMQSNSLQKGLALVTLQVVQRGERSCKGRWLQVDDTELVLVETRAALTFCKQMHLSACKGSKCNRYWFCSVVCPGHVDLPFLSAGIVWKGGQTATLGLQEVQGHWECRASDGPDGCVLACAGQTWCFQCAFL